MSENHRRQLRRPGSYGSIREKSSDHLFHAISDASGFAAPVSRFRVWRTRSGIYDLCPEKPPSIPIQLSFARITIWPSASPGQRIVSLSGRETWSTQAAVQFVIDEAAHRNLQRRIHADPATGPRGVKSEFMEILVEVEGSNNRAKQTRYLTHRYLDLPLPLRLR